MALEDLVAQFGPGAVDIASRGFLAAPERKRKAALHDLKMAAGRTDIETAKIQQNKLRVQTETLQDKNMREARDRSVVAATMLLQGAPDMATGVADVKKYFSTLQPEALGIDTPEEQQAYDTLLTFSDEDFVKGVSAMFYETDFYKEKTKAAAKRGTKFTISDRKMQLARKIARNKATKQEEEEFYLLINADPLQQLKMQLFKNYKPEQTTKPDEKSKDSLGDRLKRFFSE